jgi:XTP/dITP diphosphohydrolase
MTRLVVATKNKGKMQEFRSILAPLGVPVISMEEAGVVLDVAETGTTFEENAVLKAEAVYHALIGHESDSAGNTLVIADDSGLVVDALDGAPGIYSARYGGPELDDVGRWQLLLRNLEGVPAAQRAGRFVAAVAVVAGDRRMVARGTLEGVILTEARGENGFGYDPVFFATEAGKTTAELDEAEKNRISHRGRALENVMQALYASPWAEILKCDAGIG